MNRVRRYVFFALATLVALPLLPVQETLVNQMVKRIPKSVDVKLGEASNYVLDKLLGNLLISSSGPSLAWVGAKVEKALTKVYPGVKLEPFEFKVATIESGYPTAFAFPGGRVFVSRALVDMLTDNELTAVVAHEFGHVVLRSSVRGIVQAELFKLFFRAALFPDADGDGVQESFDEEIAGVLIEKHTIALEEVLNKLERSRKEKRGVGMLSIEKYREVVEKLKKLERDQEAQRGRDQQELRDIIRFIVNNRNLAVEVVEGFKRVPFLFVTSQYHRMLELEADQVAQAVCRAGACTLDALISSLTKLEESEARLVRYQRIIFFTLRWRLDSSHPPLRVRKKSLQHVRMPALVAPGKNSSK